MSNESTLEGGNLNNTKEVDQIRCILKIGIIMSGAISLGNFEAGVLTELFTAITEKNKELAAQNKKYVVDVITGSSAGALTAGLAASIMMNDYSKLGNLRKAWVEDVDIVKLLDRKNNPQGILNDTFMREIADSCIVTESASKASFAPEKLHLGFTVTNLNGFDKHLNFVNMGNTQTYFNDTKIFRLNRSDNENNTSINHVSS